MSGGRTGAVRVDAWLPKAVWARATGLNPEKLRGGSQGDGQPRQRHLCTHPPPTPRIPTHPRTPNTGILPAANAPSASRLPLPQSLFLGRLTGGLRAWVPCVQDEEGQLLLIPPWRAPVLQHLARWARTCRRRRRA